ncbi:hypothetical protein UACE39S_02541 [Ureibacillus acetophenoni]
MNELLVFGELHKFLNSLGPMNVSLPTKSLSIGYTPFTFAGIRTKFATLQGDKKYRCLIVHIDPGNPESTKGKKVQKEIQRIFNFDILEMRKIQLKKHEIYIPFEVIDTKEKMNILKDVIQQLLKVVLANK